MFEVAVSQQFITVEEYLERENVSIEKHEFDNGTPTLMAGAIIPHNAVTLRICYLLEKFFEEAQRPLFTMNSDTKIRIERTNRFYYPDASVVFDGPDYYTSPNGTLRTHIMTNPILVVEVMSKGTRQRDKGEKFENYRTLPTFREYLLVEPEKHWAETRYKPDPDRDLWEIKNYEDPNERIVLKSVGLEFQLADIYARLNRMKLA